MYKLPRFNIIYSFLRYIWTLESGAGESLLVIAFFLMWKCEFTSDWGLCERKEESESCLTHMWFALCESSCNAMEHMRIKLT